MKYEKEFLEDIVKNSTSIADLLRKINKSSSSASYKLIKKELLFHNIDISHFEILTREKRKNRLLGKNEIPLDLCLIENSKCSRGVIKKKLYSKGIKNRICEICGIGEIWNGKKMSLILDHINGIRDDNRLENLRIVCPNCNATLDTHCGKNIKKLKIEKIKKNNKRSILYYLTNRKLKITKNELQNLIFSKPIINIAKDLGVSDVTIHYYCKKWEIIKPKNNYWKSKEGKNKLKNIN